MRGIIALGLFLAATSLWSQTQTQPKTDAEYLNAALRFPIYFGLTTTEFPDAWARVQSWLMFQAEETLTLVNEEEIRTAPARDPSGNRYVYKVTNSVTFGGYRINVDVVSEKPDSSGLATRRAHLLAYYTATGYETPRALIGK
jgi:hypothetical protein